MRLNKVLLIGHLGADAEVRTLESGIKVANVPLATDESYKNNAGERVDKAEWHTLELWGKVAEVAEKYFKKGVEISVEGSLKTDRWKDENDNTREKTKVRVTSFSFGKKQRTQGMEPTVVNDQSEVDEFIPEEYDLPF